MLILGLVAVEGLYLAARVALHQEGFLATVLPAALFSLSNADRTAQHLPNLQEDPILDRAAQAKADDMAANGYFAHTSPQGKTPWYWLDQLDYPYTYAGENLAIDFEDAKDVEVAWMNSPTHRANILKPEYSRVGYGIAHGMYQGHETTFVVQTFAAVAAANESVSAKESPTIAEAKPSATSGPRVLAAESAPQAALKPRVVPPAPKQSAPSTSHEEPAVTVVPLPVQVSPSVTSVVEVSSLFASPRRMAAAIFIIVATLLGALYAISLAIHVSKNYLHVEMIAGGAVLVALSIGLMVFNGTSTFTVQLSDNGQAASVAATEF